MACSCCWTRITLNMHECNRNVRSTTVSFTDLQVCSTFEYHLPVLVCVEWTRVNQKPEEDKPKKTTRASGRGRSLGWEVAIRGGTRGLQDYSDWDEKHREPRGHFPLKRNSGGRLSRECATYSRNKYISESFRKCGIQDSFFCLSQTFITDTGPSCSRVTNSFSADF